MGLGRFKVKAKPDCKSCHGNGYAFQKPKRNDEEISDIQSILDDESLEPKARLKKVVDKYGPIATCVPCKLCYPEEYN